jgi:hypothetical protein
MSASALNQQLRAQVVNGSEPKVGLRKLRMAECRYSRPPMGQFPNPVFRSEAVSNSRFSVLTGDFEMDVGLERASHASASWAERT